MSAVEEVLEHPLTEGGRRGGKNRSTPSLWMLVPALAFFTAFALVPLVGVVILSFTNWDGLTAPTFAGIENWTAVRLSTSTGMPVASTSARSRAPSSSPCRWPVASAC